MANYNDQYRGSQPPPRPRYYDDDDSDYDEHTGTRYAAGSGRGWGDDNASAYMYNDRASSRSGVSAGQLAVVVRELGMRDVCVSRPG